MKECKYSKLRLLLPMFVFCILLTFCTTPTSAKWINTASGMKFKTADGVYVKGRMIKIGSYYYYFDKKGIMQTGWVEFPAGWRYFGKKDGHMWKGLQTINKKQYYFKKNGLRAYGWVTIDGKKYYFGYTTGRMQKNKLVDHDRYYVNEEGVKKTTAGFITYCGKKYYVKQGGQIARNERIVINGARYICGNDGQATMDTRGLGKRIAEYAVRFVGNPYVYGGTSLTNGADCSGFALSVFRYFDLHLLRSSYEQEAGPTEEQQKNGYTAGVSIPVNTASLKPGDLLFYGTRGYSGHVSIYIGNGMIVHAADETRGITIDKYNYNTPIKAMRYW